MSSFVIEQLTKALARNGRLTRRQAMQLSDELQAAETTEASVAVLLDQVVHLAGGALHSVAAAIEGVGIRTSKGTSTMAAGSAVVAGAGTVTGP